VTSLQYADATLHACAPPLRFFEPPLFLSLFALWAFGVLAGNRFRRKAQPEGFYSGKVARPACRTDGSAPTWGQLVGSARSFVKAAAFRAAFASATRFRPAFSRSMMTLIPKAPFASRFSVHCPSSIAA
jgi:hypothetical protein